MKKKQLGNFSLKGYMRGM